MALKWKDETYPTKLINIEWTIGKTGVLTPTIVTEPVEIDGTIVNRASVHNVSIFKQFRFTKGCTCNLYKANMIIPQCDSVENNYGEEITIPDKCPICGGETKIVKENDSEVLMCMNDDCQGKLLGKLSNAVSRNALNVDNLSEATLEKFISLGWLNSIKSIYHLSDYKGKMYSLEGFGKKSVDKLLESIEKSRETTLDRFIYALSVPLIGKSASKDIAKHFKYTVNVPNDFTIEQVESLYMSAWESGLKGVTIFRDGCKRSGILTTTSSVSDINDDKEKKTLPRGYIVVADDNVIGLKRKVMSGCGSLHIVAMFDPITGELLETYISKGSTGGCQSNLAAVSRLISLSARAGVDVYTIADQLKSCPACPSYVGRTMTKHDTSKGKCCPDAIANALIDMYKEMKNSIFSDDIETSNVKSKVIKKNTEDKEQSVNVKNPCPVCGEELTFEGGCNVCKACGWSKCD